MTSKPQSVILILNNIRSVFNVGSIFRTAECAGASKIYLVGVTPDPIDRFGRARRDLAKVALGAEKTVPWQHADDIYKVIKFLRLKEYQIVALEQTNDSLDYKNFKSKFPLAILLGEEVRGLPPEVLKKCDEVIEIPIAGRKESLNVSVAAGVALFRVLNI